jgi:hypothetical protein
MGGVTIWLQRRDRVGGGGVYVGHIPPGICFPYCVIGTALTLLYGDPSGVSACVDHTR